MVLHLQCEVCAQNLGLDRPEKHQVSAIESPDRSFPRKTELKSPQDLSTPSFESSIITSSDAKKNSGKILQSLKPQIGIHRAR